MSAEDVGRYKVYPEETREGQVSNKAWPICKPRVLQSTGRAGVS